METASLKIKFKPLFKKDTINNSKCYLEIVPEVSCLENLDKLIWRQETNYIEYTLPMTYKVILQKREGGKSSSNTSIKTYHSCVDLLRPSSGINLASGDVLRIISDTFMFKKIETCMSMENLKNVLINEQKYYDNDSIVCPDSPEMRNTSLPLEIMENKETKTSFLDNEVIAKTNKGNKFVNLDLDDVSLNKITNTEDEYPIFDDTIDNESGVMQAVTTRRSNKYESTRWLSLSPICSVNTYESPFVNKIVASKGITCKIYDSQRDVILLQSVSTPRDLFYDNQAQNNALTKIINVNKQKAPKKFTFLCRNPPEIRVVEYMQFIENEILPLKMWLNDIIRKCTALGIITKPPSKHNVEITTVSTSSGPEMTEEGGKSNRVVYSIVFDG